MKFRILFFLTGLFLFSFLNCSKKTYYQEDVSNPVYIPNTIFDCFENLDSPRFAHLIEKYQLDTVIKGETDEFQRILLLRNWIKSRIEIDDLGPYPVEDEDAEGILDEALLGQGFHCGHYMTVQNAILNAYGYVTRTLGAGPGVKGGPDGHHGINEIWSNDYNKWFLSDAKYNHHFEKNGIPLSTLEIRDEYLKNKTADIILVKGPDRQPIEIDKEVDVPKEQFAQTYTWIAWHGSGDYFTSYPDYEGRPVMYNDDFYKNNIWIRGGKPHWTYNAPDELILVEDKSAIEWTPNTIDSEVSIKDQKATIELNSDTPNFKTYQMKQFTDDEWEKVDDIVVIRLKERKYELYFRTVNHADVKGPVHHILIKSR